MKLNKDSEILIVGLGLLGGSYAKALKSKGYKVSAITKEQDSIDYAIKNGIIDSGTTEIDEELIARCKFIIFALYPKIFVKWIREYGHLISDGTLITDVTGVKSGVVDEIQSLLSLRDVEFISAHPMAGREASGIEYSDAEIFKQANYIVVPTEKNSNEAIQFCEELGRELGFARISVLSPIEHDSYIAFLSQLTHCIAVSLMCCDDDDKMVDYTGDSFRDLTRIAKINDEMWSELFLLNKKELLSKMESFEQQFLKLKNALESDDSETMREMMRCSTERRRRFDKKGENKL